MRFGPVRLTFGMFAHASSVLGGVVLSLAAAVPVEAQRPTGSPVQGVVQMMPRGVVLGDLTWVEAERLLTPDAVIVIPLGAEAKEHGPHLRLDNDRMLAEYYRGRVLKAADVIIAPTINYHFYPSFVEYPGSTHLRFETARDLVVDVVRSLAAYGPKRFYVLNTGVSTARPLAAAAEILRAEGIRFEYTNILEVAGEAEKRVSQQVRGTHADESETSAMLYMYPERVDMSKAVKDDAPQGTGGLSRVQGNGKTYSPTGVWGDATLATREKGRVIVEATVEGILRDIEKLRRTP
jgi:creatinine amidohydrolase